MPSYSAKMSVPLKLPLTLSTRSSCELWLIFLRKVAFASIKSTREGRTIATTNGRASCLLSADSDNTVFENAPALASEKRIAKLSVTNTLRVHPLNPSPLYLCLACTGFVRLLSPDEINRIFNFAHAFMDARWSLRCKKARIGNSRKILAWKGGEASPSRSAWRGSYTDGPAQAD